MENKRFINVQDVVKELGVSTSYAYKLIRELNTERAADGFVTIKGRVSRQYFDERIYGTTECGRSGLIIRTGPAHEGKKPRGASLRRARPRNGNVLLS